MQKRWKLTYKDDNVILPLTTDHGLPMNPTTTKNYNSPFLYV